MMQWGIGGLAAALLLWLAQPASADCVSACQAATYCDSDMNDSGECSRRLNDCYINECNKTYYGAIAYDTESGAVGWSYDFADAPSAERKALAGCNEHGSSCQVVVDFWNTCAAVAADGKTVAYGLGGTQELAEGSAIAACGKDGGTSCEIQAWSCTGP
jgi:hypothetical protein